MEKHPERTVELQQKVGCRVVGVTNVVSILQLIEDGVLIVSSSTRPTIELLLMSLREIGELRISLHGVARPAHRAAQENERRQTVQFDGQCSVQREIARRAARHSDASKTVVGR